MNKHRLYRKSKKIQGRGFFKEAKPILENKVSDKLNEILSKKKIGKGLKIYNQT